MGCLKRVACLVNYCTPAESDISLRFYLENDVKVSHYISISKYILCFRSNSILISNLFFDTVSNEQYKALMKW